LRPGSRKNNRPLRTGLHAGRIGWSETVLNALEFTLSLILHRRQSGHEFVKLAVWHRVDGDIQFSSFRIMTTASRAKVAAASIRLPPMLNRRPPSYQNSATDKLAQHAMPPIIFSGPSMAVTRRAMVSASASPTEI
jgi:hypothetical protein